MRYAVRVLSVSILTLLVGVVSLMPASAANQPTPGNFTGLGFDQCEAPSQAAMDKWTSESPFFAAGIYISGDSRACTRQTHLTKTWVTTQLTAGWRLLAITLGPQASCTTRERYLRQVRINPSTSDDYIAAYGQGINEATKAVLAGRRIGIEPGSTIWYDLEAFDIRKSTACTQSALRFIDGWTAQMHVLKYVSGYYSSAASGIKMIDDARVNPNNKRRLPDQIWIADWNNVANAESTYIRSDGWRPKRVHQYVGGHNETWGGVTINIDRNWLELGVTRAPAAKVHCNGVNINFARYPALGKNTKTLVNETKALKCLLRERRLYVGPVNGAWDAQLVKAIHGYQWQRGLPRNDVWTMNAWVSLLSHDAKTIVKIGSASEDVRRLQRSINASGTYTAYAVPIDGVFNRVTLAGLWAYQKKVGLPQSGAFNPATRAKMAKGVR